MTDSPITERPPALIRQPAILLLALLLAGSASAGQPRSFDFEPRLETRLGFTAFGDDDFTDTYTALPAIDLGLSIAIGPRARFVLAAGFGTKHGNPYESDESFQADDANRLRVVPITIGFRFDLAAQNRTSVVGGLYLQPAWMQERFPGGEPDFSMVTREGFGSGFLVTFGPEWRLGDCRRVLSLEFCFGGAVGEFSHDHRDHRIDTRGFQGRLGIALPLGSPEVSS